MKAYKFPGGAHPPSLKASGDSLIQIMPAPDRVVISMLRVSGAQLTPLVKRGDFVYLGQKIGDSEAFVSAPIHASVSGRVLQVEPRPHPTGRRLVLSVILENDHQDVWDESCAPQADPEALSGAEIARIAREKGVVGMGGATFPAHVKLSPPAGKTIDTLIANGAECEPVLTADDRLMRERADEVIGGIDFAMRALGAKRDLVGIEGNKPEAIQAMVQAAKGTKAEIVPLPVRYPQGGEKQLIHALTGRKVAPGTLPSDAGCAVFNVGTLAALYQAVVLGRPLIDRVVTVAGGAVMKPGNLLVRIGTSFKACVEFCGGYAPGGPEKIISGGPMMGVALYTDEVPVIAGTSGILALSGEEARLPEPAACMRCGRCHRVCPMNLQPYAIEDAILARDAGKAARFYAQQCIECGACGYICPARRHLVQNMRLAKALVRGSAAGKA
jgi:electron transport complex protein RnfC